MCNPLIRIQPIMKHNREQVNQCYTHVGSMGVGSKKRTEKKIQLH